jgi:excisionase family DNA binding protein
VRSDTDSQIPLHNVRVPAKFSPRLLRTREAAKYIAVSPWKIRKLAQEGKLPYIADGDGSPLRFDIRDLDAYIERFRQS